MPTIPQSIPVNESNHLSLHIRQKWKHPQWLKRVLKVGAEWKFRTWKMNAGLGKWIGLKEACKLFNLPFSGPRFAPHIPVLLFFIFQVLLFLLLARYVPNVAKRSEYMRTV